MHLVRHNLALLYRQCAASSIDLLGRLQQGQFLDSAELGRIAEVSQYKYKDLDYDENAGDIDKQVLDAKVSRYWVMQFHPVLDWPVSRIKRSRRLEF